VNWDRWLDGAHPTGPGLAPAEVFAAFDRVAATGLEQIIVCAGTPGDRLGAARAAIEGGAGVASPAVAEPRPALGTAFVAPSNELESQIAAIWQELLGIDGLGASDDFFELGGHSLLATRFLARFEQRWSHKITIGEFFGHPTVAALAGLVRARAKASVDGAGLAALFTEIEGMSEAE